MHDLEGFYRDSEAFTLEVDGLSLGLRRYASGHSGGPSVLLIHGASASSDTFLVPEGGLVRFLRERTWDVWTLDWRGSCKITDALLESAPLAGSVVEERRLFRVDRVAEADFPAALAFIRKKIGQRAELAVVAHCFGAGSFSVAIARGCVEPFDLKNVVLTTLGLFYEAPWDGWMKVEDFILERLLTTAPECRGISPAHAGRWPQEMLTAFNRWPAPWLPPEGSSGDAIYRRLAFMFGEPYLRQRLAPGIHGPLLRRLFGHMHLGLYLQAGQMLRRGYAAPFDSPDVIDRKRLRSLRHAQAQPTFLIAGPFRDKRLTLITGAENRLWHRDSIDLMYEWLLAEAAPRARPKKHVLAGFAHQDLLWGASADREVYPLIQNGIERGN